MFALPFRETNQPALSHGRVTLRPPRSTDYGQWAELRRASRDFLQPWEPRWASDDLERRAWRQRLRRYRREFDRGAGYTFFVFLTDGTLIGGISIANIRHGVAQSAQIGYWVGQQHAGKGLMLDALSALIPFGFDTLRLHRIEAACMPENKRSVRLLEKARFQREGLMRSYLKIDGVWRDHFLYALVAGR